ncbi:MAG TPA: hypothetical protein PLM53_13175 [Spirochaetota bacterium]|nr:hypothetical protein [Spirochaetota bacterium]HPC40752.1 hypothetical protein [Spirochaetota bacterium]HQF09339.1 hypothetical protein [Spirochaetota bacterium]HQH98047.1 hypothetical protein [Spirochaetota bacterium]HQJ71062.1 hypothetical protein [Spirochaetota bacterium]
MKDKKIFIIAANVFIAVILIQTYFRPVEDMKLSGAEQKARPGVPTLNDVMTGKFQNSIELWLKQNIGFRGTFVKTDNQINYSLFNEFSRSHPRKILLGNNKELFEEPYIDCFNKLSTLPPQVLEKKATAIQRLQEKLKARNVRFLLLLTPSKASIYPEAVPEKYVLDSGKEKQDNYQVIVPMLKRRGVNIVDSREIFLEMKKNGTTHLFPSSGSHWSLYGGYLIGTKTIERMEQLFGRRMVRMETKKLISSREPIDLDKDIARLGNLLFTRSLFTDYVYPETSPDAPAHAFRPDVLLVGSSFCWNFIHYIEQNNVFSRLNFYYYYNTDWVYPGMQHHPINRAAINWDRDVLTRDIIIVEINEIQINEAGFGFVEDALNALDR